MVEKITGVKFSSAAFGSQTVLEPFVSEENGKKREKRISLVFGKNGSGKSTISRAIAAVAGKEIPEITNSLLIDVTSNPVTIDDTTKKNIVIFNEDYTRKNVQLREDGLSTIVMLGDTGDLTKQIERAVEEDIEAEKNEVEQSQIAQNYDDEAEVISPKYYLKKMQNSLKGDDHWAGRERLINDSRQNANVTENIYKSFIGESPIKTKTELAKDYATKIEELNTARTGSSEIGVEVPTDFSLNYDESDVIAQLSLKIENPQLTKREESLLQLAEERLVEISDKFSDDSVVICPYCLQDVNSTQKQFIVEGIQKVLNHEVDEHKNSLQGLLINEISVDFKSFEKLEFQDCQNQLENLNSAIRGSNQRVHDKIQNVYTPINVASFDIKTKFDEFIVSIKQLEQRRIDFNNKISDKNPIVDALLKINAALAYYEIIDDYNVYTKQLEAQKSAVQIWDQAKTQRDTAKAELSRLKTKLKSIDIAEGVINESLKYIFFSANRLRIEVEDDTYKLTSNGKPVKPANVSVGERNIIALCHFFANIMVDREQDKAYGEEFFIVIDDPISSFDLEIRIGMMSFLKFQLSRYLLGNVNTKLLLMTHDLSAVFDFEKMLGEIKKACKSKYNCAEKGYGIYELTLQGLSDFKYNRRHEYSTLIEDVFRYANNSDSTDENDAAIGNMMRRALEAFSTFEYKKGINEISLDENIISLMQNEHSKYFENLMYRLILNGESHMEEQVKSLVNTNFYDLITVEEKRRTAKDILCLIYVLNKNHLVAHLSGIKGAIVLVEQWCNDIKTPA